MYFLTLQCKNECSILDSMMRDSFRSEAYRWPSYQNIKFQETGSSFRSEAYRWPSYQNIKFQKTASIHRHFMSSSTYFRHTLRVFLRQPQIFQKPRRHFRTENPQILDHAVQNIANATWRPALMRLESNTWLYTIAVTKGEGGRGPPPKRNLKKYRFCSHDDINGFMLLTRQTKLATEMGWWWGHWNIETQNKNLRM